MRVFGWTSFGYGCLLKFRHLDIMQIQYDVLKICLVTTLSYESSINVGNHVLTTIRVVIFIWSNVQALKFARNWLCGFEEISKFKNLVCLRCFVYSVGYIFMLMIGESELFEEDKEGEERGRKKIWVKVILLLLFVNLRVFFYDSYFEFD